MRQIILAITGASGAAYARGLARIALAAGCRLHVIVSPHGLDLLRRELGVARLSVEAILGAGASPARRGNLTIHDYHDLADCLASGSTATDGMAVCPCSSNTLAAVAAGLADNLIARAAHVHLKERRRLVLVTREMPVSAIELANQLRLARAGAIIAPASPGFYLNPRRLEDLVQFVAARAADCLGIGHNHEVWRAGAARGREKGHKQKNQQGCKGYKG